LQTVEGVCLDCRLWKECVLIADCGRIVSKLCTCGKSVSSQIPSPSADLDDTLLHTGDLDAAALEEVAAKLAETHPQLPWSDVHGAWLKAFKASPWTKPIRCMRATQKHSSISAGQSRF
jgi:hypothetical protein